MYPEFKTVRLTREDDVLYVTMDRPDDRNAFNADLHRDLTEALEYVASQEREANVIVLGGAGDAFSAGGDLRWFREIREPEIEALFDEARRLVHAILGIEQVVIASVPGPAVGLGATLMLMCDLVVVAETTRISDPHVSIGVVAGDGGVATWPLMTGLKRAKRYLLTGEAIDAATALDCGLVDWVVPREDLRVRTAELARRVASGPQGAIRGTKRALNLHLAQSVGLTLDYSLAVERPCFSSADHREAVEAFLDKRAPVFGSRSDDKSMATTKR